MLTKDDLKAIKDLIKSGLANLSEDIELLQSDVTGLKTTNWATAKKLELANHRLEKISEDLERLKKDSRATKNDIKKIRQDINLIIETFDDQDIELKLRVERLEEKVGV